MDDAAARERLTRLWVDHREQVVRFVARRAAPAIVDDVVSETYLVAWRRVEDVPTAARAWLFGVARTVLSTQVRTQGRWQALGVRLEREPTAQARGADDAAAERADLRRAWDLLGDADREVLALVAWDGLSAREAAQVLECRPSTFSVRLTRARKRLLAYSEVPRDTATVLRRLQEERP
ncbi:RNA polymerase sigma factor [Isoptericola sp. 178]|uniref:RNA polymerase sigma factor n=1 Tax=Isoptericola sp. 178 TaxID=3064651 RepID=UPI00271278A0|nr:sigma-70 family RNA polymerase sigma factor [Isoptericola sp. 178]MDO8143662.1 sigma-70 family RNA polymerase sigma factor [Isoptericola sp. 178]